MPRRLRRSTGLRQRIAEFVRSVTFSGHKPALRRGLPIGAAPAPKLLSRIAGPCPCARAIPSVETWESHVRLDEELVGLEIDPRELVGAGESPGAGERLHDGDGRFW